MMDNLKEDAVWKALGNPNRRKLLDLLRDGPRTTGDLANEFPELSRYAVMQHLGVAVDAGLVLPRKKGPYRYNFLNPAPIQMIYERWMSPFAQQVGEEMTALANHIKSSTKKEKEMSKNEESRIVRIEAELPLAAAPEEVFRLLTTGLGDWWPHLSREGAKVVAEPKVGGRIYEDWGDGGGMLYGFYAVFEPPFQAVTMGSTGFQGNAYNSRNTDQVEATEDGAVYKKTLLMWGMISEEVEDMFRNGTGHLLEVLKQHVEDLK